MMNRIVFLSLILFSFIFPGTAQFNFPENGRIIFERKINTHAVLPKIVAEADLSVQQEINADARNYMANHPQFWKDSFQLFFQNDSTYYEPIFSGSGQPIGIPVANRNKIYVDLLTRIALAEKNVYNETIFLKDSVRKIKWKLTDETREIAGYECRRANAIIMDSIYVVAFYTDAIKTKGGPEQFNGLPGMILGVVLPHYHISYFATGIDLDHPSFIKPGINVDTVSQDQFKNSVINYLTESRRINSWIRVFMGL